MILFWGFLIQKVMGMLIGFFLYKDLGVEEFEAEDVTRFLQLRVTILEGRDLVAKDKNMWGKRVSSDPYVKVFHGSRRVGKTCIVKKSLNPKWTNQDTFVLNVLPRALDVYKTVECNIFDHDQLSTDDSMGTCYIEIPTLVNAQKTGWYTVEKGEGRNFCRNAKGELKVQIEVRSNLGNIGCRELQSSTSQRFSLSTIVEK